MSFHMIYANEELNVFNSIMFPLQTLNPQGGGTIFYYTTGMAPNRQFIVVFNQVPASMCSELQTQGVILYETSNCIDIVIGNKTSCGGITFASEGLQNADVSRIIMVTGRNRTTWDTNNETYRFCPVSCFCASLPSAISGPTTVCAGSYQIYSIEPVPGATSYQWTVPTGWTITDDSGTSITAFVGDTGATIAVQPIEDAICSSAPQKLNVTVNVIPTQPDAISGPTNVVNGSSQFYAIAPVPGATSVPHNDLGTSVKVTVGDVGGIVSVTANNACGSSNPQTLTGKGQKGCKTPSYSLNHILWKKS